MSYRTFGIEAIRATRAAAEPKVDLDVGTGAKESELPGYIRWLGIKPLNQVLESLLGAAEVLLEATEPRIGD